MRKAAMSTVAKALQILDLFSRTRPQIGLSDLARLAGLNKATCFRLVSDLCDAGLVEQVDPSKEYRLGPALLRLAALRETNVPLRDSALPVLQALANDIGETTHLSLLVGGELRPLAHAYSTAHASKITMEDVRVFPFHATSSGMVVAAFQTPAFREAVLSRPLSALTPQTTTDPAILRARLRQIESDGFAENLGSFEADVHSFAVPLFDALGRCTGALSTAALAGRMTAGQITRIRSAQFVAARAIIALWGGEVPPKLNSIWNASETFAKEPT
jgi:DNA-binding IclR family transcriptional regulator